jgi:8-oxo-dGTP diphosphatase
VVYSYDNAGELRIALICDKHHNWGLPKGKLEAGETISQAAHREICEEIGLEPTLGPHIGQISYPLYKRRSIRLKTVDYFLAAVPHTPLRPRTEEGITVARWASVETAHRLVTFAQVWRMVERGVELLEDAAD